MPGIIRWSSFLKVSSNQLSFRYPHLQSSPVDSLNSFNINVLYPGLGISPHQPRRKLAYRGSLTFHIGALQLGEKCFRESHKKRKGKDTSTCVDSRRRMRLKTSTRIQEKKRVNDLTAPLHTISAYARVDALLLSGRHENGATRAL